jgi:Protein of unknown function (DUF1579)
MNATLQKQHQWLDRLIGEWIYESECNMGPDQPPSKSKGFEVVRSLGGLWTIGEGEGEMPDGNTGKTIMTLGYDPQSDRYIGTFVASMMTHLWIYNGSLDATQKVLTLDTEGPNFSESAMTKYQDIIEFVSDDHRILRSQILGDDGNWNHFMTAHYRRK